MSGVPDSLNAALEGRYRIERQLGEGGMVMVYLADDLKHEQEVALKVLKPELAAVVGAERFLGEIKTTANLRHPHIRFDRLRTMEIISADLSPEATLEITSQIERLLAET